MNAPPASARDGAFLALALADALKLGLPDPDYITMSPRHAGSTRFSAVSFQFNDRNGQDPLPALYAWAGRFGVAVEVGVGAGTFHPSSTWHKFEFTHAGVLFDAYAEIVDANPEADAPSIASDEADDMGEDPTDSIAEDHDAAAVADAYNASVVEGYVSPRQQAAAVLGAAIEDDEADLCGAERDGRRCKLRPHEGGEHDSGGWRWSDVTYSVPHRHGAPEACGLPVFGSDTPCPLFADHDRLPGCPGAGERVSLRIGGGVQ